MSVLAGAPRGLAARARRRLGIISDAPGAPGRSSRVTLGDVGVDLEAPEAVSEFVAARFPSGSPGDGPADVVSRFHVHDVDVAGARHGRRMWRDGDGIWCTDFPQVPGLTVRFDPGPPLRVETWLVQSQLRQAYKSVVAGVTGVGRLEWLTAYAIVHPALLAADVLGRFPLHAAGVAHDGHGIVLAGPPGVGKSTMTAALAARGARILSDNIVLAARDGLWAFPEPVKLDERSRELAGGGLADQGAGGPQATHARTIARFEPVHGPVPLRMLVLLERGRQGRLDELDAVAVEDLLELNRLAFELHSYYLYRAMARLAVRPPSGEHESVAAALAGAEVVRLVVADDGTDEAVESLLARL